MASIRTLIVDDEPLARDGVRVLLARDTEFEIVGECANGLEAIQAIRRLRPDLVFLDVQMPQMTGIEALRRLEPADVPVVIFVTAHDQYAVEAFEHHALDYLLKPFDDDRFERTIRRIKTQLRQQEAHDLSRRMMALVDTGGQRKIATRRDICGSVAQDLGAVPADVAELHQRADVPFFQHLVGNQLAQAFAVGQVVGNDIVV